MLAGGVVEIIWHFAAYWRLLQDESTVRLDYETGALAQQQANATYHVPRPVANELDLDETGSGRIGRVYQASSDALAMQGLDVHLHLANQLQEAGAWPRHGQQTGHAPHDVAAGGSAAGKPHYAMSYAEGEGSRVLSVTQGNYLNDSDVIGDGETQVDPVGTSGLTELVGRVSDVMDEHLTKQGFPAELRPVPAESEPYLTELVAERDAARSSQDDVTFSVSPGIYVDGVLQEPGYIPPAISIEIKNPSESSDTERTDAGSLISTGSNQVINGAQIIDLSLANTTLLVKGDYFLTNVIAQVNAFDGRDQGLQGASAQGEAAEDVVSIAAFQEKTYPADFSVGPTWSFNVHVDYTNGDLYHVNWLDQTNWLVDNDVVQYTTSGQYSEIRTGDNQQINLADVFGQGKHYDLIIVAGDYHVSNMIYQANVVLDTDIFQSAGGSTDEQAVLGGGNRLTNQADISVYGSDKFDDLDPSMDGLMDRLLAKETVESSEWWQFAGSGSSHFNVLVVTQDMYEINLITQTNVVADADIVGHPPSDTHFEDENGQEPAAVRTGGNNAFNIAQIIDVGTAGTHYIGGDHYHDSVLIQAELLQPDSQPIVFRPVAELVPEIVAFTSNVDDGGSDAAATHVTTQPLYADVLGSVLS